jgi:cytoskeleton protein RodZ
MSESQEAMASESQVAATLEASATAQPQADTGNLSPGAMLRAAREMQDIPIERIADELHLSKATIEAIESDEYAVFSAPVFAKGHLRRYALRVGVNVDDIVSRYERLDATRQSQVSQPRSVEMTRNIAISSSTSSFRIAPRSGSNRSGSSSSTTALWIVAAIIVLGALAWTLKSKFAQQGVTSDVTVTVPATSDRVTTMDATPSTHVATENARSTGASTTAGVANPASQAAQQSTQQASQQTTQSIQPTTPTVATSTMPNASARGADPNKLRIQLRFSEDSWAEVVDGTGKVMLYDVGRADLPRMIDVVPPARVLLGNAPVVNVQVNGKPLTIPSHRIISSVARFTVNADGTVR